MLLIRPYIIRTLLTLRLKVLWKNLWRSIVCWGKGQFGRNYQGQGRALPPPSTRSNKIPLSGLVGGIAERTKAFSTFWPAKWLKRIVSMLSTGKQKFVCRRVVNYLNTLQTKAESHLKDLGIISFQDWEKGVLVVSIFDLIFEFTIYMPFQPKIGSESNN